MFIVEALPAKQIVLFHAALISLCYVSYILTQCKQLAALTDMD